MAATPAAHASPPRPMLELLNDFEAWKCIGIFCTNVEVIFQRPDVLAIKVEFDPAVIRRPLVFKVVRTSRPGGLDQFVHEVAAAKRHFFNPTMAAIVFAQKDAAGNMLLVSPYAGESLDDLATSADYRASSIRDKVAWCTDVLVQLAVMLLLLKGRREVHADLKPANLARNALRLLGFDLGLCVTEGEHTRLLTWGVTDDPVLATFDPDTGDLLFYTPGAIERHSRSSADVIAVFKTLVALLLGGGFPEELGLQFYQDQGLACPRDNLMQRWCQVCHAISAGRCTGVDDLDDLIAQLQQEAPELLGLMRRMCVVQPDDRITILELARAPLIAKRVQQQVALLEQDYQSHCLGRQELQQQLLQLLLLQLLPADQQAGVIISSDSSYQFAEQLSNLRDSLELCALRQEVGGLQQDNTALKQQVKQMERRASTMRQHITGLGAKQRSAMASLEAAQQSEQQAAEEAAAAVAEAAAVKAQAVQREQQLQQENQQLRQQLQQAQAAAATDAAQWLREKEQLETSLIRLAQQLQEAKQAAAATAAIAEQLQQQQDATQAAGTQPLLEQLQQEVPDHEPASVACGKVPAPSADELQLPPLPAISIARTRSTISFEPDTPECRSSAGVAAMLVSSTFNSNSDGSASSSSIDGSSSSSMSGVQTTGPQQQQQQQQEEEVAAPKPAVRCWVGRRCVMGLAVASVVGLLCVVSRNRRH